MKITLPLITVALCLSGCARHLDKIDPAPQNMLSDCVIQEVLPDKNMTGAFFKLHHHGAEQTLIGAQIPSITGNVELHEMTMKDGVMSMQEIESYPIKEGETRFKKGGYHLMLMDIAQVPEIGSQHEITLKFADGSKVQCQGVVKTVQEVIEQSKAEGMTMDMDHHHHHGQ